MRIFLISTWYPYPPDNGSKQRVYYLLRALAAQHDVTAVAFRPPSNQEVLVDDRIPDRHPVTAVVDDPFRQVNAPRWVKYLSPSPLVFRASNAMQRAVSSLADSGVWDAFVAVQMPVGQYASQVNAHARIIDIDTALAFQMRERYMAQVQRTARARAWMSWQKAHGYERRMLRRFDAATVVSRAEVASLEEMVKGKGCTVAMISNGADCRHLRPGLAVSRPGTLVYNGSLTYSANYDAMKWFLEEIYPRIKTQLPAVALTITGSTRGVDLAGLALDESVQLTGFVEDVRLPVAEASVCVVPIRQGGGTRLKILEAMALGTPVVSTFKGTQGLEVVHGEHLMLADDPATFANRTIELLSRPDLCTHLTANARRLVEARYDWQAIGAHFVNLVEETVRERKKGTG